ncbi:uncharacterized protein [Parasteatoda tepidariorum]|uniref:uncharacterized protein isoform X6 n=1 Tax=Parasteatoda tepidariorum TaxID=114398 RepID=UPI00077FB2E8
MGSCVSHCSRQDVVHQQTGRVITDVQKSIEISPGSSLLQKTFAELRDVKDSASEDKESKNTLASVAPESNDVRVQINNEIRALREQLVRSQVVFTYLLKNEENRSKSCDGKNEIRSLLDGGNLSEIFHCKSFDGQVLARFYNRSNRSSSSYTSHRSTPMHCGYTSISCPTLPIDSPVVTKSTQTEPVSGVFIDQAQSEQNILINSITKRTSSPPSTPCGTVSETFLLSDICEIHKEPEDHSFPRHRTNSFLAAVKDGNPKLVNAEFNFHSDMKQIPSETNDCVQKRNEVSHFLLFNQSSSNNIPSSSKIYDLEGKSMTDETKLETVSSETKSPTGREEKIPPRPNVLERAKSDSDAKLIDDKSIKNFKCSQRSFRRSSGTGSPNSQLPRYPAFDFSEQEDIHSLLPSPSEPEATMKREAQSTHKSDDYQHNRLHLKNSSNKKQDSNKSKTLMPELMENSETESTKGSFECEALDIPPYSDINSLPVPDIAFPSLPNTFLAKLGVHKDSPLPVEAFDEQELESKFIALSLAFKTDRPTLSKRLELHKRQRDMAEKNVENEFQAMRDHLMTLNLKATSSDVRDLITKIQNHLDIAQQATSRVSGRSETYGAVQQEERVSRAFEVLVLHVDHLKRLFDKEHKELEETRKMLTDTRIFRKDVNSDVIPEDQKKYSKTFGLPVGSIKSVGRRRASVAEFQQRSFLDNCKTPGFSQSWTSGLTMRKVETKQQVPSYSAVSTVDVNSVVPDNDSSPNRTHTSEINVRRCSLPSASPNIQTSPKESTPVSFPKNLSVKPERNIWTRKLSAVTDEKEQSEDEAPKSDEALSKQHHESVQFLLQVQKNTLYQMKDESPLELVDLSDDSSEEVSYAGNIVNIIKNSEIGKYLNSSNALWQQNNTWTLMRYFCSGILLFVSLCILISMILSWGGIYLSFIMDFCFTLITYIIY